MGVGCWAGLLMSAWALAGCKCEPGHIQPCDCGAEGTGESVCSDTGATWGECQCPICDPGETEECLCYLGYEGFLTCSDDGLDWGICECNPCAEYVNIVCGCEGVEDFYEAIGTTCADTYQPLIDEGDPEACALAMDAFEAAGGCDQFGNLGDDDDTN